MDHSSGAIMAHSFVIETGFTVVQDGSVASHNAGIQQLLHNLEKMLVVNTHIIDHLPERFSDDRNILLYMFDHFIMQITHLNLFMGLLFHLLFFRIFTGRIQV